MKITKAIELLEDLDKRGHFALGDDITPAIKLAIGALKRCKTLADNSPPGATIPLPGETKD